MALIENAFSTIVLTAQTFNPSIFNETWLVQNGVLDASFFVGSRVFSPQLAQFETADVQVLIIPPKMQITFGIHDNNIDSKIPIHIASKIIELLPQTPYQGLGLNFDYFITPSANQSFPAFTRTLLGTGDYPLLSEFSSSDAKFGRYFSKDYGKARLKLDIKPVIVGPEQKELLGLGFNFHHDLTPWLSLPLPDRVGGLTQLIASWESLRQYAVRLVELGSNLKE